MGDQGTKKPRHRARRVLIIALIVLVALYTVGGWALSSWLYRDSLARNDLDKSTVFVTELHYGDIDHTRYPRSEFRFDSGENELVGYDYGERNTRGLIVISSGAPGGTGDDYMSFATRFIDDGYRVITYDKTGTAQSGGDGQRGVYQGALDMDALLTHIESQNRYDDLPVYLLGHSWGGYGVCAALINPHRVNAVISMAGYNDGSDVVALQGVEVAGAGFYLLYPHLWLIQKMTFGPAMDVSAIDGINATDIPVLVIQGANDEAITADGISIYAHRDEITNAATEFLLTDGDHEYPCASEDARRYQSQTQESWAVFEQRPEIKADLESNDMERIQSPKEQFAREIDFDKPLYNQLDESIIERIEALFDQTR
ncbi:MAG: lysophospholipase [Coriobacteriales bacterium]|jgi:alpha-beta hydrolase superfamily lysophospholipase|nr:lysophospholipase [Coriobacteriales bacterium]